MADKKATKPAKTAKVADKARAPKAAKTTKAAAKRSAKKAAANKGFTAEERAAMREYVRELRRPASADGESDLLAKVATMPDSDRVMAERLHAIVKKTAPELGSRTWYGMPAYTKDGNVVCYFQDAAKFKARYAMLGFSDKAKLDNGSMWPVAYALDQIGPAEEKKIAALIKQALN